MSEKKCKTCGAPAEWVYYDEPVCERCLSSGLDIKEVIPPCRCDQCSIPIYGCYIIDEYDDAFCSRECAFKYYDAKKLGEEDNDQEDCDE